MTDLTLRRVKGAPLTHNELDDNFTALDSSISAGIFDSGLSVAGDVNICPGDLILCDGDIIFQSPASQIQYNPGFCFYDTLASQETLCVDSSGDWNFLNGSGINVSGGGDIILNGRRVTGLTIDTTAPAIPGEGDLWLDPDDDTVRVWDGDVWFAFPSSGDSGGTFSDVRFKEEITTIDGALDKVSRMRGVEFDWNTGPNKGKHDLGVVAQELEQVTPELVSVTSAFGVDDAKKVDYAKITAVLIEAVKELKAEVEELKKK